MTADYTPPAEAVEAAAKAMWQRPDDVDDAWPKTSQAHRDHRRKQARIALTAAYPAIVAEKDAETTMAAQALANAQRSLADLQAEVARLRAAVRIQKHYASEAASASDRLAVVAALAEQHADWCCSKGCTGPGLCASGPDACVERASGALRCDESCNCPSAPYLTAIADHAEES